MKVSEVHQVKDRGLMVSVEEPLEKLSIGWMVGYDTNVWEIVGVDIGDSKPVNLYLNSIKGEAEPKINSSLERIFKIKYTLQEFAAQAKKDLDDYEKDWSELSSNAYHSRSHSWIEWWGTFIYSHNWEER